MTSKRKLFLVMWFLATFLGVCFAQDVIITKDAKKINAKVTEVNIDNIKYKNFDNQDGPTYTLLKSVILSILYQNGTVETFEAATSPEPTSAPTPTPAPTPIEPPTPPTRTQQRRAFSYANMQTDDPSLYMQYKAGKNQVTMGTCFILIGVGSVIGGVAMEANKAKGLTNRGGTSSIVLGSIFTAVVAIPITISGSKKKRNAMNEYLMRYSEASGEGVPHLQLNVLPNGLGLAYVF